MSADIFYCVLSFAIEMVGWRRYNDNSGKLAFGIVFIYPLYFNHQFYCIAQLSFGYGMVQGVEFVRCESIAFNGYVQRL